MRQFTLTKPQATAAALEAITFYVGGQTVPFVDGACELVDPSPAQLAWLDEQIRQKLIVETTPEKKTKPSQRAAKKKRG